MSRDFCHKKCMGCGQPRDCAMKKWRLFDREQWWFLLVERRADLSSACLNTGCKTCATAAVFYLSFLLFSVVVVGVSCFQLWETLGQVKNIDFEVCKLLTQVLHATLDTLLAKARSFLDNCTFWDRIRQRECRWRIKLPTNPLDSVFVWTGQLQQLSRPSITAVLHETATQSKQRRLHAREIKRLRHVRVHVAGCIAIAISPEV